jgi:hypothetical protein
MAIPGFTADQSLYQRRGYRFRKKIASPAGGLTPALQIRSDYDGNTYVIGESEPGTSDVGGAPFSGDIEDMALQRRCIKLCLRTCNTTNTNSTCYKNCFKGCYY